jgi:predicted ribosomally synthesized peptide with nif11-like leader
MAMTAVQTFLEQVTQDQSLQEELATAMESDNDRQVVTDLARSKGYEFTSDELWQEIQNRQTELQQQQENGELSEEELEAVAGGEFLVTAVVITASIGMAAVDGYLAGKFMVKKVKW